MISVKLERSKNFLLGIAVFFVTFVFFYSMNLGIVSTNDGSHYALFKSIIQRGEFKLKDNLKYAMQDTAIYKGEYYSDRHPGTAFTLVAFYFAAWPIKIFILPVKVGEFGEKTMDAEDIGIIAMLLLLPAAIGAGLAFMLYFSLKKLFGISSGMTLFTAVAFAFATIALRYSALLYSHILTASAVFASHVLFVVFTRKMNYKILFAASALLSYAALCEHIAVVLYIPLSLYLIFKLKEKLIDIRFLVVAVISSLLPISLLFAYNYVNFDNPFVISHFYHSTCSDIHGSISTTFVPARLVSHLKLLLFRTKMLGGFDFVSLFSSSPFLVLIFLYPLLVLKSETRENAYDEIFFIFSFLSGVFAVCLYAIPIGGYDFDYRHFLFVVPLLSVPFAVVLSRGLQYLREFGYGRFAVPAWAVLWFVFLTSIFNQFGHIRVYSYQTKYPFLFYNFLPAIWNCGIFLCYMLLICFVVLSFKKMGVVCRKSA